MRPTAKICGAFLKICPSAPCVPHLQETMPSNYTVFDRGWILFDIVLFGHI